MAASDIFRMLGLLMSSKKRAEKRRREQFEIDSYNDLMQIRAAYAEIHKCDIEDVEYGTEYQQKYLKKAIRQAEETLQSLLDWWVHFNSAERVEKIIKEELQDFARKCALLPVPIKDYDEIAKLFFDLFPHLPVASDPDLGRFASSKSHTTVARLLAPYLTPIPAPQFAPVRDRLPPVPSSNHPDIRVSLKVLKLQDWGDVAEWVFVNGAYELPPRLHPNAPQRYLTEMPQRTSDVLNYYASLQQYREHLAAWKNAGGTKPVKPSTPPDFWEAKHWGDVDEWIYRAGVYRPVSARDRKPDLHKDIENDIANVEVLDKKIREQIPKDID